MAKKRVLIVSKFYYNRGGAEVVAINMVNELRTHGYEVGVFAMDYPQNVSTENFYVAPSVGFAGGIMSKLKFAARTLGYSGVARSFSRALEEFRPDIVHVHNIHSYLSPIVVKLAKRKGCKVFWTLHDYKLICPSYSCLNNGKVCEKCLSDTRSILREKCFKNGIMASCLAFVEACRWNRKWIERYVDYFICPSRFIARQMIKGGYAEDKMKTICNFIDPVKLENFKCTKTQERKDYYVYVGRLSHEKGVATLLDVAKDIPFRLVVVGGGPLKEVFQEKYADCGNIEFLGHQGAESVAKLLSEARFSVIPSEWYENNPLSVIESLCAGTPVVGADIGGIPELISKETGSVYPSGDASSLYRTITKMLEADYDYEYIANASQERFSFMAHYKQLEKLYK